METLECFTGDKRGRTTLLLRRAPHTSVIARMEAPFGDLDPSPPPPKPE